MIDKIYTLLERKWFIVLVLMWAVLVSCVFYLHYHEKIAGMFIWK